jgi:hypothetical protein
MRSLYLLGLLCFLIASCGGNSTNTDTKDSVSGEINPAPIAPDSLTIVDTGVVRPITPVQ